MKISLLVKQSPFDGLHCQRAVKFAKTAISLGHDIPRVFFYGDGTLNGHIDSPIAAQWQEAVAGTSTELVLCSTSAEKNGIHTNATANGNPGTLAPAFECSGLGQLLVASMQSDRMITFG